MEEAKFNDRKYPKHVFLIILNEFCERFSFYGLRTVLYLYFTEFIKLDRDTSTIIYHVFVMLCYFTPIIGAIIADGYIGLFKTILYLSFIYLIGEIIVTLTSILPIVGKPNIWGPCVGLFIIAIGTGGIKPCVSAFGGNQFDATQTKYIETFFSVFYLSINIGSTVATLVTPIFRADVKCFGNDCYALAFGVPLAFMAVSIVFFISGSSFYRKNSTKKNGNIILKTSHCIYVAIKNKIKYRKSNINKKHWLDHAENDYDSNLISSVKSFCKVLVVFIPVPIFWALYDQQGSRWTSQAQQLNGRIGSFTLKPDQFQAVNPLLIVVLVPIFDYIVYPFLAKFNLLKKQLQRMGVGLVLAVLSFLIAAILELQMQNASAALNLPNQIRILNASPCQLSLINNQNNEILLSNIKSVQYLNNHVENIPKDKIDKFFNDNINEIQLIYSCQNDIEEKKLIKIDKNNLPKTLIFYLDKTDKYKTIEHFEYSYETKTNKTIGSSQLKFSSLNIDTSQLVNEIETNLDTDYWNYTRVDYTQYNLNIKSGNNRFKLESEILLETCGRYTILLFENPINNLLDYVLLTDIYPNGLHITWQIIQIFVMTIAEIMFAISGISFAYSQAPESMKSVLQASWYFTIAIGNSIVVIVAEAKIVNNQVWEYIIFAGLLGAATVLFIILAYLYKNEESNNFLIKNEKTEQQIKREVKNMKINSVAPLYLDDGELIF